MTVVGAGNYGIDRRQPPLSAHPGLVTNPLILNLLKDGRQDFQIPRDSRYRRAAILQQVQDERIYGFPPFLLQGQDERIYGVSPFPYNGKATAWPVWALRVTASVNSI